LFGEFVTDAAGAAGDQNRIAHEFHIKSLPQKNYVMLPGGLRINAG
jgi:hypothetical protein